MVRGIKRHIELKEDELSTHAEMRTCVMKWAALRTQGRPPDAMQLDTADEMKREAEQNQLRESEGQWASPKSAMGAWNSTYGYGSDGHWGEANYMRTCRFVCPSADQHVDPPLPRCRTHTPCARAALRELSPSSPSVVFPTRNVLRGGTVGPFIRF